MGQQAGQMLLKRIDHPAAPAQTRLLPPRLEVAVRPARSPPAELGRGVRSAGADVD